MLILTYRTDKPEAEMALYDSTSPIEEYTWQAHRALAETLHIKTQELLSRHNKTWADIEGVVVFNGPGSFTGLRIGATVANTLAQSLRVPIIGTSGDDWLLDGIARIIKGENNFIAVPEYGADVRITPQKR